VRSGRVGVGVVLATAVGLFAAAAAVVFAYPELAIRLDRILGGGGGDGSALGYFRAYYVLPGALSFLIVSAAALALGARRGARSFAAIAFAAGMVLIAALVFSVKWYFHEAASASRLTGVSRGLPDGKVVAPMGIQMSRLGVREALLIRSRSVDGSPVWSPDGRYLAAKVDGKWIGVEPDSLELARGVWHGQHPIASVASVNPTVPLSAATVREWGKDAHLDPRSVTTRAGTRLELRQDDLGTQFVVTRKSASPETRWTTSAENCHGLALSPDERYVAFICEQNGVIVAIFE
jgi:hypothetical protein